MGADRAGVLRLVLGEAFVLVGTGLAVGVVVAALVPGRRAAAVEPLRALAD